ncbi:MAG TPA: hypothetical protein VGM87_13415 [Roseomonas sp.]|jgi:hypothetical protein
MVDSQTLQFWRLIPIDPASAGDVWACSRFQGCCEVVAANERLARLQAAGAYCLPVAPEQSAGICPWLSPNHVRAELIAPFATGPAGVVAWEVGVAATVTEVIG